MKKSLSDKEVLVNTICNNMREIIVLSQNKRASELAAMIIGQLTLVYNDEDDFEDILCDVEDALWKMESNFEFSYVQYVAQVSGRIVSNYWGHEDGN